MTADHPAPVDHWGQHTIDAAVINVCDGRPYQPPRPDAPPCRRCDTVAAREYRART
jgi:hypothetical protein